MRISPKWLDQNCLTGGSVEAEVLYCVRVPSAFASPHHMYIFHIKKLSKNDRRLDVLLFLICIVDQVCYEYYAKSLFQ